MSDPRHSSARDQGFTLVEALVALAILGAALMLGLTLVWQQPRSQIRLRAQQEALGAIESALEEIRAGAPPAGGFVMRPRPPRAGVGRSVVAERAAQGLQVRLQVQDDPTVPGLKHVTATAFYRVLGQPERRTVRTMVWRR